MGARLSWALLVVTAIGCGRVNYDERRGLDANDPAACPSETTEIQPGGDVCIELVERGTVPWTTAKSMCASLGRRLCADAEWFTACVNATGLVDMIDGGYEWVAEEMDGVALKRGSTACTVMSSHAVVDPYEYRCCVTR